MTGRRWIWGAVPVAGVAALLWAILSIASDEAKDEGVVRIVESAPSPAASPGTSPVAAEVKRIPIVATHETVTTAVDQAHLVAREKRDPAWAERSEAAIATLMQGLPYVGGSRHLEIKCAASACEVEGFVDADAATGSFTPVWEALERDSAGEALRAQGLERTSAIFDTGRNPDEFKIYYRRIATPR